MNCFKYNTFVLNKFEQKKPVENSWHDWLINYIPELIRKKYCGFKDKVVNLFKTNTHKDYAKKTVYGRGKKPSKPKSQKQSGENIIKSIKIDLS